jgi:hypothetical protein
MGEVGGGGGCEVCAGTCRKRGSEGDLALEIVPEMWMAGGVKILKGGAKVRRWNVS